MKYEKLRTEMKIVVLLALGMQITKAMCPAGNYLIENTCQPCPIGLYQEMENKTYCEYCPSYLTTSGEGSASTADCHKEEDLGCYEYDGKFYSMLFDANMTTESCLSFCVEEGLLYAAVMNGTTCICNSNLQTDIRSDSCLIPCEGDTAQICGGETSINIYKTPVHMTSILQTTSFQETNFPMNISGRHGIRISATACADAIVALRDKVYDIIAKVVIGGSLNVLTAIKDKDGNYRSFKHGKYLHCQEERDFWIDWRDNVIRVGEGHSFLQNIIVHWQLSSDVSVHDLVLETYKDDVCWRFLTDNRDSTGNECQHNSSITAPLSSELSTVSEATKISVFAMTLTTADMTSITTEGNKGSSLDVISIPNTTISIGKNNPTNTSCACNCSQHTLEPSELENRLNEIKKILTVERKHTQKYTRSLTSARDDRVSAVCLGVTLGPILLSAMIIVIVILDFHRLIDVFIAFHQKNRKQSALV